MSNSIENIELDALFEQSRYNCPENIRNNLVQWEVWSMHYFRDMWKEGSISSKELSEMIDRVCSF